MAHKLLLADDSVTIQRVIELTFADEDVQVIAVGDGRQAIERIEADRPDIVLADVGMPERDGYEVAAYVKRTPHLSHIPVLLLTGAFEPIDEQRASDVGCDGVLAKPFEPHMVITRVKELLADAPPPRAAAPLRPAEVEPTLLDATMPVPRPSAASDTPVPIPVPPSASPTPVVPMPAFAAAPPVSPTPVPLPVPPPVMPTPVPESRVKTVEFEPTALPSVPDAAPEPALDVVIDRGGYDMPDSPALDLPVAGLEDHAVESTLDAAVRISRRTPIAVPGFGTPPPPQGGGTLDDYFDRLDAAFASLQHTPQTPVPPAPEVEPGGETLPMPRPTPADAAAFVPPDGDTLRMPAAPAPAAPAPPVLAQAFSALFAAEHGEGDAAAAVPSLYAAPAAPAVSTDELVERVTEQVLQRLSDRVVRETVADIVSRVAEKLVREEIERVKSTIK